jgi:hypothetical protein
MNKFLVFSSVGDSSDAFYSWLGKNKKYDTAVVYYGDNDETWQRIKSLSKYSFRHKGHIFSSLVKHFSPMPKYQYYLIVDDDIEMNPEQILNTFFIMDKKKYDACAWTRDKESHGFFKYAITSKANKIWSVNFLEQCQIFISKQLLVGFIEFVKKSKLENLITGWDILLSNFSMHTKQNNFRLIDFYVYHNPHPKEKKTGSREIDRDNNGFLERSKILLDFINQNQLFFLMLPDEYWGDLENRESIIKK